MSFDIDITDLKRIVEFRFGNKPTGLKSKLSASHNEPLLNHLYESETINWSTLSANSSGPAEKLLLEHKDKIDKISLALNENVKMLEYVYEEISAGKYTPDDTFWKNIVRNKSKGVIPFYAKYEHLGNYFDLVSNKYAINFMLVTKKIERAFNQHFRWINDYFCDELPEEHDKVVESIRTIMKRRDPPDRYITETESLQNLYCKQKTLIDNEDICKSYFADEIPSYDEEKTAIAYLISQDNPLAKHFLYTYPEYIAGKKRE